MDKLKVLHKAERNIKTRGRRLAFMARKRGDSIRKIADDFGSAY